MYRALEGSNLIGVTDISNQELEALEGSNLIGVTDFSNQELLVPDWRKFLIGNICNTNKITTFQSPVQSTPANSNYFTNLGNGYAIFLISATSSTSTWKPGRPTLLLPDAITFNSTICKFFLLIANLRTL